MAKKKPGPGRPAGQPNHQVVTVPAMVTRCPSCSSTERHPYYNTRERAIAGVDGEGNAYTHVIWRRAKCADCGQVRDDRHTENRSD